jgi:hypothetical protein
MKVTIPTDLNEIPLAVFEQYTSLPEMDEEKRAFESIAIFCDAKVSEIRKWPLDAVNQILEKLATTINQTPKFQDRFTLNGTKYGFIPNLDELTTGEFIDLETYVKENAMWKIMSVLFRPVIIEGQNNRYEIGEYKGTLVEDFKMMPTGVAYGAMVFFWSLGASLLNSMVKSLAETEAIQTHTQSIKNGAGLDLSIGSLTEISQEWTRLSECPYTKLCYGVRTRPTSRNTKRKSSIKNDE